MEQAAVVLTEAEAGEEAVDDDAGGQDDCPTAAPAPHTRRPPLTLPPLPRPPKGGRRHPRWPTLWRGWRRARRRQRRGWRRCDVTERRGRESRFFWCQVLFFLSAPLQHNTSTMASPATDYEAERARRIAENMKRLAELGVVEVSGVWGSTKNGRMPMTALSAGRHAAPRHARPRPPVAVVQPVMQPGFIATLSTQSGLPQLHQPPLTSLHSQAVASVAATTAPRRRRAPPRPRAPRPPPGEARRSGRLEGRPRATYHAEDDPEALFRRRARENGGVRRTFGELWLCKEGNNAGGLAVRCVGGGATARRCFVAPACRQTVAQKRKPSFFGSTLTPPSLPPHPLSRGPGRDLFPGPRRRPGLLPAAVVSERVAVLAGPFVFWSAAARENREPTNPPSSPSPLTQATLRRRLRHGRQPPLRQRARHHVPPVPPKDARCAHRVHPLPRPARLLLRRLPVHAVR